MFFQNILLFKHYFKKIVKSLTIRRLFNNCSQWTCDIVEITETRHTENSS